MVRNALGSILGLAGAAAAVWSPFRAWYDGRLGRDYRIADLFNGITDAKAEPAGSLLLPFAFAALVALVAILLRSRLLMALAGLVVLGFTVFWMVRQGQAEAGLAVKADGTGLGTGVAYAAVGGVLLLLASALMDGRRRKRKNEPAPRGTAGATYEPTARQPEPAYDPPARNPEPAYDPSARRPEADYEVTARQPGAPYDPPARRPEPTYDPSARHPEAEHDPTARQPGASDGSPPQQPRHIPPTDGTRPFG
jgi:hypothetical protein